MKVTPIS